MQAIAGYNSQQNKKRVFKKLLEDPDYMNEKCRKVYEQLESGDKTAQEIGKIIGMETSSVFARMNELAANGWVIDLPETKKNPITGRPNTIYRKLNKPFKLF